MSGRFWYLWASLASSSLVNGTLGVAAPLLAATITDNPTLIAGLSVFYTLPIIAFSLLGGALADRIQRRSLMIVAGTLRAAFGLLLGVAVLLGWESFALLYASAFVLGTCAIFFDIAAYAVVPAVVPKDRLDAANGRIFAVRITGDGIAGRPIGGLLFSVAGSLPFLACAVGELLAVAFAFRLPGEPDARGRRSPGNIWGDIVEGTRWLWRHRVLRAVTLVLALVNLTTAATFSVLVLYATEIVGLSAAQFGLLMVAFPAGGVLGSLLASRFLIDRMGRGGALLVSTLLIALSFGVVAASSNAVVVGIALAGSALGAAVWNVISSSLRQSVVPDELLGRIGSAMQLMSDGSLPLGALTGGILGTVFGLTAPYWAGAILLIAAAVLMVPRVNNSTIRRALASDTNSI